MNDEIRSYFELEAKELVDRLTRGAAQLDGSPATPENASALQRAAHTLKGAAHVVGELGIAALAHDFEDALTQYRDTPDVALGKRVLSLADALSDRLTQSADRAAKQPTDALENTDGTGSSAAPASVKASGVAARQSAPVTSSGATTVRVDSEEVARLLTQINVSAVLAANLRGTVNQLMLPGVASQSLSRASRETSHVDTGERIGQMHEAIDNELHRLERQLTELHRVASQLSLISTGTLLVEAGRIARSTAAASGRDVKCVTRGGNDRVDLQVVDLLQDALLHLIRNAVVHGIESPAERTRAGKPAVGTITVSVTRDGSNVNLSCSDDGRGIDLAPIREAAVKRGLLSNGQAAAADSRTLLALLLEPQFTTRTDADQMAGRGVGLDAVRDAAERLRGEVRIVSEPGAGSTFTVIAPGTLFSLAVLEVSAGGVRYALPAEAVVQTFVLAPHHKVTGQGSRTVLVERETMPYLRLQDLMPASPATALPVLSTRKLTPTCVVLRTAQGRVALAVDRVESSNNLLMQPLPAIAATAETIAGAALLPDGQPFLVLNPANLFPSGTAAAVSYDSAETQATGPILVIDDSLTTRMLEQSILEAEEYVVDLAVSAEQGLAMARRKSYALFLVDVEMPGMNGFEFVRAVKADPELNSTPCILVTSLDSAEDRERGRAAGAVSYVVKGEFNQQVYLDRIRAVMRGAG